MNYKNKKNIEHIILTCNESEISSLALKIREMVRVRVVAFTLAEVLITLGIIGVVAAMTIPNLLSNVRAKQYINKYKKVVSTLSNAARLSSEEYGFDFGGIKGRCTSQSGLDNPESKQTICALLNGTLKGASFYYGVDKIPNYDLKIDENPTFYSQLSLGSANKNSLPIYILSDGSIVIFSAWLGDRGCSKEIGKNPALSSAGGSACYGIIDVNGITKPNKEIKCTKGNNSYHAIDAGNCIVSSKDVNDVFPFVIYDGVVVPWTRAGWYLMNNSK